MWNSVCCISLEKHLDLEKLWSSEEFWSLESIGITDSIDECDDGTDIGETVRFVNHDGRYQVTFPWKPELPDNSGVALRRLKSLVRRLKDDSSLLQSYDYVTQQQLSLGIIETVQGTNISLTNTYYLPHHLVLAPSKSTTKISIVYDASLRKSVAL